VADAASVGTGDRKIMIVHTKPRKSPCLAASGIHSLRAKLPEGGSST
jgi:hypothetical protein